MALIRDHYTRLGSVFTVRLFHLKLTFLVGPDVSSHFYQGLDSEISQDEVSQFTIPTFGPGVAFDVDYATRREQFRFFGDAMKPVKLRTYAQLMVREVEVRKSRPRRLGVYIYLECMHEFHEKKKGLNFINFQCCRATLLDGDSPARLT